MTISMISNAGAHHCLLELERARCSALVAGDVARVAALASPDLIYVHSPGVINTLGEFLDFLRQRVRFGAVERRDVTLHVKDRTAWMTGLLRYVGRMWPEAQPFVAVSFVTQVWTCGEEGWQMTVCQSTRVDDGAWERAAESMSSSGGTADTRFAYSATLAHDDSASI